MKKIKFGTLLKRYRTLSGLKTLSSFADALADEGLVFSESILSRWQKGSRLPRDRKIFIVIIKIFIIKGSIKNIYQANNLLAAAGKGYLSFEEVQSLLVSDGLNLNMNLCDQVIDTDEAEQKQIKISLSLPRNMDRYLDWLSDQYKTSKAQVFRDVIDKSLNDSVFSK